MLTGLARAIESALARAGGREFSRMLEGSWGAFVVALLVGLAAFLIFRALKFRRSVIYAALLTTAVFALVLAATPVSLAIEQANLTNRSEQEVRNALIDPASAQIDVSLIRRFSNGNRTVCGWVNARARNGAYQGPQLFSVRWQDGTREARTNIDPACRFSGYPPRRDCETTVHDNAMQVHFDGPAQNYCPVDFG